MKDENILIFCGFLDLFSVSILITSLPLHVKAFNISTTYIGIFFSLYGALQILSSYLMGYLADKMGKKIIICACALLTAIGYFALGIAQSFFGLFLLRIISGLSKQTQTISRTILATKEISDSNYRVVLLGRFSTFSSIGFIFGPPIGGYLYQHYGFFHISCASSLGFILIFILFLNLDSDSLSPASTESTRISSNQTDNVGHQIKGEQMEIVHRRKLSDKSTELKLTVPSNSEEDKTNSLIRKTWDIQLSIFLLSFCPLLFRTNYSLALKELFDSTSILSGFASSYGAVTGSIAGLVVPGIIRFYRNYYSTESNSKTSKTLSNQIAESKLLFHTTLTLALSFLGCCLAPTLTVFILFQSPVSFVNGLSREAFNLIITKRVSKKQVGRVMGMTGSLIAFGRLFAPIFGGIMQEISYRFPLFCSAALSFIASGIVYKFLQ